MNVCINQSVAQALGIREPSANLGAMVEQLARGDGQVATLKDDDRSTVTQHMVNDVAWVVKRYHLPAWKRWLYGAFRATPAWREWSGAMLLAKRSIRVCQPLAIVPPHVLIYPFSEGQSLHDWMRESHPPATRLTVAKAVGKQMGQLTRHDLVNRDHKPTNLIIDSACESGNAPPLLIDPAGLRGRSTRNVIAMFSVMHRATARARGITMREGLTALRAAMRDDPSLTSGTAAAFARRILQQTNARPLSYDPADWL